MTSTETHYGPGVYGGQERHRGPIEQCTYPDCFDQPMPGVARDGVPMTARRPVGTQTDRRADHVIGGA
jgi:hypothetical protein